MSTERQRNRTPGFIAGFIADFIALLSPPEGTVDPRVGGAFIPLVVTGPERKPWFGYSDFPYLSETPLGPGAPAGGESQGTR